MNARPPVAGALTVFIAEDEQPARERLVETLARVAPDARVVGGAASVRETAAWLATHPAPDLLLLDIRLADGSSLDLFRDDGPRPQVPVVFTTAYDQHVLQAFDAQAVDYLLKPVSDERLAGALAKHERLRRHFAAEVAPIAEALARGAGDAAAGASTRRRRLLGRSGSGFVAVPVERLAYVVSLAKESVLVTHEGERATADLPLAELERELDPARFFRVSRQVLVSAEAVCRFAPNGKGGLLLELAPPLAGEVKVSEDRAAAFRRWLAQ